MKVIITESKLVSVLHTFLNNSFEDFDNLHYDWVSYNCGMGECCDPYAIGGFLPSSEHSDDYLFKFVDIEKYDDDGNYPSELSDDLPEPCHEQPNIKDPRFDTIVLTEELHDRIYDYFGEMNIWENSLLSLLNRTFGINANEIIYY